MSKVIDNIEDIDSIDSKANLASPTFTGTVVLPSTTSIGTVSNTEISYLDGVTSAIQTQLGTKANLASPTFTGTPTLNGEALVKLSSDGLRIEKSNDASIKNQCTAWVNFDGTTTPPTIRDSYNVSSVVRTATGTYDVYFTTPMDNVNYIMSGAMKDGDYSTEAWGVNENYNNTSNVNKIAIVSAYNSTLYNFPKISAQIFGGKN